MHLKFDFARMFDFDPINRQMEISDANESRVKKRAIPEPIVASHEILKLPHIFVAWKLSPWSRMLSGEIFNVSSCATMVASRCFVVHVAF